MKTLNLLNSNPILENTVYEYQNQYYTYSLKLIPEMEIRAKYEIHCSKQDLVQALKREIDSWVQPETFDLLELTACVYDVSTAFGRVFYLSSYIIEVNITHIDDAIQQDDDTIVLPDFQLDEQCESSRIIKDFKNFR